MGRAIDSGDAGVRAWSNDFINKIICGDCLEVMREMPSKSIDMCLTSPPYWGLRDYGVEQIFGGDKDCEHEWGEKIIQKQRGAAAGESAQVGNQKNKIQGTHINQGNFCLKCHAWKGQLGLEPTPEMYIEHMTEIFHEVKRVLKKEGTLWLNVGDTYGGSCQGGGDTGLSKERYRKELLTYTDKPQKKLMPKCMLMIPERLAWSLIQDGWILRNKIPWIKPNCMPSSVKDRFTNKWEYVFLLSKNRKYYFDLDSVREPHSFNRWSLSNPIGSKFAKQAAPGQTQHSWQRKGYAGYFDGEGNLLVHPKGKNPGDIWTIPTVPCPIKGIHFATFPEELCRKAILPGSPEEGIVLDPFCGIGTACYVAQRLGRKFIGIDIKQEYCEKADKERLAQAVL